MGNLEEVLTDSFLNEYDKLFCLGHMTIYRNTPQNNRVFMSEHNGRYIYREVLATPEICWFDEEWNNDYNILRSRQTSLSERFIIKHFDVLQSFPLYTVCRDPEHNNGLWL